MFLRLLKQIFIFFAKGCQRQVTFELHTSKEVALERLEEFLEDYFKGEITSNGFIFYSKSYFFSDLDFQDVVIDGIIEDNGSPNILKITFRRHLVLEVLYLLMIIFFAILILGILFFSSESLVDRLVISAVWLLFPIGFRFVFQYGLKGAENKFVGYLSYLFNSSELREI